MHPTQISWDNFINSSQEPDGIRIKFENLCRQLFINENLSENVEHRYLHADPNNPGIEAEPILDEKRNIWVGFQAKYFSNNVSYDQIFYSAEKTVKYYAGRLDKVYLFCNQPLTSSSIQKTIDYLHDADIDTELVTDNAILDLVRQKYPYLGLYYFGCHNITHDWFVQKTRYIADSLGERYNKNFNVPTDTEEELSLFVHDRSAVSEIDEKRTYLLHRIDKFLEEKVKFRDYLTKLKKAVTALPFVTESNITDALNWLQIVEDDVKKDLSDLRNRKKELTGKSDVYFNAAFRAENESSPDDRIKAKNTYFEIQDQIKELTSLIRLPRTLWISDDYQHLITDNVLLISGRAGTGKSHLLAHMADRLISSGRDVLILTGGRYIGTDPIRTQIMNNLGVDFSFDELIDILESRAEEIGHVIPVFVDAINETWMHSLWKNDISEIIDKVKSCRMVRIVFSFRPEYKSLLFPQSIEDSIKNHRIIEITHNGFAGNDMYAIREFLNYYNIPFSPTEYFSENMYNPLFLTMYCKTYKDGNDADLPELYNRFVRIVNEKVIHDSRELSEYYSEDDNLVRVLVDQIADHFLDGHGEKWIYRDDLVHLSFWSEYGIAPASFVRALIRENLLYSDVSDDKREYFYFSFDQMNDYYCAKAFISRLGDDKVIVKNTVADKVRDGSLCNEYNIELFLNICALYADAFKEECIGVIDEIPDDYVRAEVFSYYVSSFTWRSSAYIIIEDFCRMLRKYECRRDMLWDMLIGNSARTSGSLNADGLNSILSALPLNKRDYYWTTYINGLDYYSSNRLYQLIRLFAKGESIAFSSRRQEELLLTLMSWLLTSSNRPLRDHVSKAMVEIMKHDFYVCRVILEKFRNVNDPYVLQRLYGIVFGVCCKRDITDDDRTIFKELAETVYRNIFSTDSVYPDILLRDYARLIIEYYLHEYPDNEAEIDRCVIRPPYASGPITEIDGKDYWNMDCGIGTRRLLASLKFDGMGGLYGDFGRYVFQGEVDLFDVDDKKICNYAAYYILNDLDYSEELFGEYDSSIGQYDGGLTVKTERIGKKYEWIAMYNILARMSDHCRMKSRYSISDGHDSSYNGTWQMYIRDVDPTLNISFLGCPTAPRFDTFKKFRALVQDKISQNDLSDIDGQRKWLDTPGLFLEQIGHTLLLKDDEGTEWISLSGYRDVSVDDSEYKPAVAARLVAYFVTQDQVEALENCISGGVSVNLPNIISEYDISGIYNREYPWSPACQEAIEDETVDSEILGVGKLSHASVSLNWSSQYDSTINETISVGAPCSGLIQYLHLRQRDWDGYYFDESGNLASFDISFTHSRQCNNAVIRRDLLERFLRDNDLRLIWIFDAEKRIRKNALLYPDNHIWQGMMMYEDNRIRQALACKGLVIQYFNDSFTSFKKIHINPKQTPEASHHRTHHNDDYRWLHGDVLSLIDGSFYECCHESEDYDEEVVLADLVQYLSYR